MMKDLLGLLLFPVAVVALFLIALMVDSTILWIHWAGVILVAGIIFFGVFFLVTLFSVCKKS